MTKPVQPDWSDAEIKTLKQLWSENYSAAQISKEIGRPRNAVIGKAHRLGLTPRGRAKPPPMPPAPPPMPMRTMQPLPKYSTAPVNGTKPVTIWQLENRHCRWPLDGEGEHMRFCGHPSADLAKGIPYCQPHTQRSHGNG
jgi:GcrA cell cycle regulator